jgi:hypothetical protein
MDFTQTEAQATVGRHVRVRDEALLRVRIARGAEGAVVSAQLQCPDEEGSKARVWVVCLEFALTRNQTVSVVLRDVDKEQYVSAFEEVLPERSPEPVPSPEGLPSLPPPAHLARRAPLTLVSSSGLDTQ